jgi:hypothetical protein
MIRKSFLSLIVVSTLAFSATSFADDIVSFGIDTSQTNKLSKVSSSIGLTAEQIRQQEKDYAAAQKTVKQLAIDADRAYHEVANNKGQRAADGDKQLGTLLADVKLLQQAIGVCSIDTIMKNQHQVDLDIAANQRDIEAMGSSANEKDLRAQTKNDPNWLEIDRLVKERDAQVADAKLQLNNPNAVIRGMAQDTVALKTDTIAGQDDLAIKKLKIYIEQNSRTFVLKRNALLAKRAELERKKASLAQCGGASEAFVSDLTDLKKLETDHVKLTFDMDTIGKAVTDMREFQAQSGVATPSSAAPRVGANSAIYWHP